MNIKHFSFLMILSCMAFSAYSQQKSFKDYRIGPIHSEVVDQLFLEYDVNASAPITKTSARLNFMKHPKGWYVYFYDFSQKDTVSKELFWNRSTGKYRKLAHYDPNHDGLLTHANGVLKSAYLRDADIMKDRNFKIHPYHGYEGWELDAIHTFENMADLSEEYIYGLARAYGSYANRLIRLYFDDSDPITYPTDSVQNNFSDAQLDTFRYYVEKGLAHFQELKQKNPCFETIVGEIHLKYSGERSNTYDMLRMVQNEKTARSFLVDNLYSDFLLAIARNTLKSCKPNAIVIAGGDNDYFPLQYVQVHEGLRPDVSILIHTYMSAPKYHRYWQKVVPAHLQLPIRIPENQYDYLTYFLVENDQQAIDLDKWLARVYQEEEALKVPLTSGSHIYKVPAETIVIKLDSLHLEQYHRYDKQMLLPLKMRSLFERRGSFYLNDFTLLNLIQNNEWKRPIYLNYTSAHSTAFQIAPYLKYTGSLLELQPYKSKKLSTVSSDYDVDVEAMLHNFRQMELPELAKGTCQPEAHKFGKNIRHEYTILAGKLYDLDRKEEALEMLDKSLRVLPIDKIPMGYFDPSYYKLYSLLGKKKKAAEVEKHLLAQFHQYTSSAEYIEIQTAAIMIKELLTIWKEQQALSTEEQEILQEKIGQYQPKFNALLDVLQKLGPQY